LASHKDGVAMAARFGTIDSPGSKYVFRDLA